MRPGFGRRPVDAAVVYAHRGWAVFPCHAPARTPAGCSCGAAECASPAKHPRVAGGLKSATTDNGQIEGWWARWPNANVAIRTGEVSGLVVVDIDPDHGGDASLECLVEEHGSPPVGRVVRTGSGGRHLYFRHPGGVVRNDAGRRLGPGLDIRGTAGTSSPRPRVTPPVATTRCQDTGGQCRSCPTGLSGSSAPRNFRGVRTCPRIHRVWRAGQGMDRGLLPRCGRIRPDSVVSA